MGHADDTSHSEATWTNGYEHTRSRALNWKFLSHETIYEGGIYHHRHHESNALYCKPANDNLKGLFLRQSRAQNSRMWADNQQRIGLQGTKINSATAS